jgi:hypothetical protein
VLAAEAGFLPRFAFPFVKLYGSKAEKAFEVVATLLLNWCSGWFELFPNPPLPLLRRFLVSLCWAEGCGCAACTLAFFTAHCGYDSRVADRLAA